MAANEAYRPYHPHWLRHRVSTYWWLARWSYFLFILRELSSLFVAWTVLVLLAFVSAAGEGAAAYEQALATFRTPTFVLVNVIALLFLVLHAVTWFGLAPRAMVVHLGGTRVPGATIVAAHYAAWAIVSAIVVWIVVRA
jgi:fumarate reductase subunit C